LCKEVFEHANSLTAEPNELPFRSHVREVLRGANQVSSFQAADGKRFVIASANNRDVAEALARQFEAGAIILAVQPQWSFPAESWIDADPGFWRVNPGARGGGTSRGSS
jgi:hypothetical protein